LDRLFSRDDRIYWSDTTSSWSQSKTNGFAKAIGATQQEAGPYLVPSLAIDGACLYSATADSDGVISRCLSPRRDHALRFGLALGAGATGSFGAVSARMK
jgi:hypothetical protein